MRIALLVALSLTLSLSGCGCSDGPEPLTERELESIPALTPPQLEELVAAQKGKLMVFALWSTRREASVTMYQQLGSLLAGDEPVVIAVNIDRVSDIRDKVVPIVEKQGAKLLNHVVSVGPEALSIYIDPNKWAGQLPAIAVYDRAGKKAGAFYGPDALAKAREKLAELVEKPKR